jgi:glycosyltransferase involved in cell wall biosynthesis
MLVSVIIPNYNHSSFLRQRIDSILRQEWQDFELIILDDNSSDESHDIITGYKNHPKISHYVHNNTNSGSVFKQWEKGLALAKGEYIWIAESDDFADTIFLSVLMKAFALNTDLIVAFSNSMMVDKDSKPSNLMAAEGFIAAGKGEIILDSVDFCKKYLLATNNIPNASAVVFKKSFISADIFPKVQSFKLAGDWLFWFSLLNRAGKIYYTAQPLNYYRFHNQTVRFSPHKGKEELHLIERFRVVNSNQKEIILNLQEHRALQAGMIEKLISSWIESRYSFSISSLWRCLQIIKQVHPGAYLTFIKSYLLINIAKKRR